MEGAPRRGVEVNQASVLKFYKDPDVARRIARKIKEVARDLGYVTIMHVCGTHEWTITHYGIRTLLPRNVDVRAGPGCPVCITPAGDIDLAIKLAMEEGVVVTVYGDMSRAKGSRAMPLEDAKSMGGDIRLVYSVQEAFEMARREREKRFLFFGVGFDTTAPATAFMVLKGAPPNMSILSSYRYIPPAVGALLEAQDLEVDGILCPGHSSTVTGMKPYKKYFDRNPRPMVFGGFEPVDVLLSIYLLLRQIRDKQARMVNEYRRSVTWMGNTKAMSTLFRVFDVEDGYWRGLGVIPESGFRFKDEFRSVDAREVYSLGEAGEGDAFLGNARCQDVIKGKIDPVECPLYMKECSPDTPKGPPMVSVEGTCRIWAEHKVLFTLRCRRCGR